MAARNFTGGAVASTLNGGISSGDTSILVASGSTWPTGSASYVIDRGLAGEEKILATRSGNTLTATSRGYDGTTAAAHSTGAVIEHVGTATDFQEANDHIQATTGHGATGAVVGTTNTQTLTNKTIALGSNTVSGTTAQFNTAVTDGDFVTTTGTETLTGKTINVYTSGTRPSSPSEGMRIYETDTDRFLFYNGSAWVIIGNTSYVAFTPALTGSVTNPTLGTGSSATGTYCLQGTSNGHVDVEVDILFGTSGAAAGSGNYAVSVPFTIAPLTANIPLGRFRVFDSSANTVAYGDVVYASSSTVALHLTTGALAAVSPISAAAPMTWSNNDLLSLRFRCRAST